jgi:lysophospholipase L1-like esterase
LDAAFAQAPDPARLFANPPADFVHPSAAGFHVIARALADAIAPLVGR